jgi:hypothetical protein
VGIWFFLSSEEMVMGSEDDHLRMPTHERAASLATSQASARRLQSQDAKASELGQANHVPLAEARAIIADWPEAPKKAGEKLLDHYGEPHEATPTKLFWYRTGPWARMELSADEVVHNFPTPHTDYLTQYVDYPVTASKASELVEFDGSVIVDRTAGQIGARCDHEAYNTLTLNLAVEIMEGRRTVEDARRLYGETANAFVLGRDAPYAEGLLFQPPAGETGDADESIIATGMAHQAKEKIKDAFGAGETPT